MDLACQGSTDDALCHAIAANEIQKNTDKQSPGRDTIDFGKKFLHNVSFYFNN